MSSKVLVECRQEFIDKEFDLRRKPGYHGEQPDRWETTIGRARGLENAGFVRAIDEDGNPLFEKYPWGQPKESRFLENVDLDYGRWERVVACLNIWNDLDALKKTYETWYPYVDHVIAVDGAYGGSAITECASTDGTVEFLESLEKVEVVPAPDEGFWKDQIQKRNEYFKRLKEGDLGFVVDADEFVREGENLQGLPYFDVGWVPYKKGIYNKEQNFPRLFNGARDFFYSDRHYWIQGDRGFVTDGQRGGPWYDHMFVPVYIDNEQGHSIRPEARLKADRKIRTVQAHKEAKAGEGNVGGRESLRIVQLTSFDPGMVVFRLHTAINSTTPHESVMASGSHERVYEAPYQWDLNEDRDIIRRALQECDVIHCHLGYHQLESLGVRYGDTPVVVHHHGTMYRREPEKVNRRDVNKAAVRFVSNPELLQYDDDLYFLPNPVPVMRYRRLRERLYQRNDSVLRVGHSPSKRWIKGTEEFLAVCEELNEMGCNVDPILIEGVPHAQSLEMKARLCDVFFDSFWLSGIQCSGLEAGAMKMPVIGGDEDVLDYFAGDPPYLYANSQGELGDVLYGLYEDMKHNGRKTARREAEKMYQYVLRNHDYAAVTENYLNILDEELSWRSKLTLGGDRFLKVGGENA